jgi:hypothetical protein
VPVPFSGTALLEFPRTCFELRIRVFRVPLAQPVRSTKHLVLGLADRVCISLFSILLHWHIDTTYTLQDFGTQGTGQASGTHSKTRS